MQDALIYLGCEGLVEAGKYRNFKDKMNLKSLRFVFVYKITQQ